jgi:hypothetical protein
MAHGKLRDATWTAVSSAATATMRLPYFENALRMPECRPGAVTMPRGFKGIKRPRDPAQLAKLIVDIATGEVEDRAPTPEEQGKDPVAVGYGKKGGEIGGKARAESLSDERR